MQLNHLWHFVLSLQVLVLSLELGGIRPSWGCLFRPVHNIFFYQGDQYNNSFTQSLKASHVDILQLSNLTRKRCHLFEFEEWTLFQIMGNRQRKSRRKAIRLWFIKRRSKADASHLSEVSGLFHFLVILIESCLDVIRLIRFMYSKFFWLVSTDNDEQDDECMDGFFGRSLDMEPCIRNNELRWAFRFVYHVIDFNALQDNTFLGEIIRYLLCRIFVGTWNVAGRSPVGSLALDLIEWLHLKEPADIYVLGYV